MNKPDLAWTFEQRRYRNRDFLGHWPEYRVKFLIHPRCWFENPNLEPKMGKTDWACNNWIKYRNKGSSSCWFQMFYQKPILDLCPKIQIPDLDWVKFTWLKNWTKYRNMGFCGLLISNITPDFWSGPDLNIKIQISDPHLRKLSWFAKLNEVSK